MSVHFCRILLPYGWMGPARANYQVERSREKGLRVTYASAEMGLRVHRAQNSNYLVLVGEKAQVGRIEWAAEHGGIILRNLSIDPLFQGYGLAKLLGWLALKDIVDSGWGLAGARAEGVMEAEVDEKADPRAATLFAKLGFNCLERNQLEHAAQMMWRDFVEVRGNATWPHLKVASPLFGTMRVAMMLPEGLACREGSSRGILQERRFYENLLFWGRKELAEAVLRGAAYLSGNYYLAPELTENLTEKVRLLPPLND